MGGEAKHAAFPMIDGVSAISFASKTLIFYDRGQFFWRAQTKQILEKEAGLNGEIAQKLRSVAICALF